ncbi:uncharacterized protein J4E78_009563 [Alternaria triticimaculans]|uniref:uncharacterized protein n=1 Tax=Alternaria triticimaculans TaxID=297637 RepID=UPI0020C2A38B|nr:uncharacterized protein J4E78_009563 [Alternaria triticimaculans]KAI4644744.1 hypothetical protein J4E78_009563 [Alternaria triticimaculans]
MAVIHARGATKKAKKHQPILQVTFRAIVLIPQANISSFGGRLLRLRVGPQRRTVSVHEDMLCKRSKVFKDRFQPERKDVEGECVICQEGLDPMVKTLTYCKSCGNNLHEDCMEEWSGTNSTCPMCRAEWVMPPFLNSVDLEDTNANDFDMYVQWLYGHTFPKYATEDRDDGDDGDEVDHFVRLYGAYFVAADYQDDEFLQAVREEIIHCSLRMTVDSRYAEFAQVLRNSVGPGYAIRFVVDLFTLRYIQKHQLDDTDDDDDDDDDENPMTNIKISKRLLRCLLETAKPQSEENDEYVWSVMRACGHIE